MGDLDIKLFHFINGLADKSHFWDQIFALLADYVVIFFAVVLLVLFFRSRRYFWIALSSSIVGRLVLTVLIRYLFPRPRPFLVLSGVRQLIEKNQAEPTFPSGHTAIYFAVAYAVFLWNKKWGAVLLVAALFLSLTRVFAGVHYPSDILGGAVVGIVSAWAVEQAAKKWYK